MLVVLFREDQILPDAGDPDLDVKTRHRHLRGSIVTCLPDGADPGAKVLQNPRVQIIEVTGLTLAEAQELCESEYDVWRSQLPDSFFSDKADPRHTLDHPRYWAKRYWLLDLDDVGLPTTFRNRTRKRTQLDRPANTDRPVIGRADFMAALKRNPRANRVAAPTQSAILTAKSAKGRA